ncbi:glycoside hydrolase family 30 protein [Reinekea marina]|uniref:Glycoside hydrolase family 30 protein n=1 Tax=Reinekea marina TaxID=1310421 RepID=A0ABV7WNA8_9GAMM|nr:glycoside hydrolase family 30 protein [Reinekea marina]MDN3647909.1 glycoside hydrolase family 30 protein [Reinekea marina]
MICVQTSKETGVEQKTLPLLNWRSDRMDLCEVSINPDVGYQTHLGLGGAFTESAAVNYQGLSKASKTKLISNYFDPMKGSGYNIGRIHMNSCDFSLGNWDCQSKPDSEFSIDHYEQAILPMIRDAEDALGQKIKLVVSPWSPPSWMKTNGEMNNGGQLKPEFRAQWANYYVQFIKALQENGFEIWGLTIQNEPEAKQIWDSCLFSAEEERDFIRDYLGPALFNNNLKDIKVICWDHNRDNLYQRARVIYSDAEASKYVWGAGFHWYVDDAFDNVQAVHDAYPDKGLLFTEGCQEGGPHTGEWEVAERYGISIISDFNKWTCGWLDWNLLLDSKGGPNHVGNLCSAPVLCNASGDDIDIQPSQLYLNHLSPRFIPELSQRILSASPRDALKVVAFKRPDLKISLIVMNIGDTPVDFQINLNNQYLPTQIAARAIQTYVF